MRRRVLILLLIDQLELRALISRICAARRDDCFHEVPGKARAYALELAYRTGCSYSDDQRILRCLREDRTWHEISGAAAEVSYRVRSLPSLLPHLDLG